MKKVIFIFVVLLFCFSGLFALKYKGKNVDLRYKPLTWEKMGGDVNFLETFEDNVGLLVKLEIISQSCADSLIYNFNNEIREKVLIVPGNKFDGEVYGGKVSPNIVAVLDTVTIGNGFSVQFKGQPASAWLVKAFNSLTGKLFSDFWFQTGLNGKTQCNNNCFKEFDIPKITLEPKIEIRYFPEIIYRDSIQYQKVPYPVLRPINTGPSWVISGWLSHSQDHFAGRTPDSLNFGDYFLTNVRNPRDDRLIYTLEGCITGKLIFQNWYMSSSFERGYQDGPVDGKWRIGVGRNWFKKKDLEGGFQFRHMDFVHYWMERSWQEDLSILVSQKYIYGTMYEMGPYAHFNYFSKRKSKVGVNHLSVFVNQNLRPERHSVGTFDIYGSLKLEPKKWYLLINPKFQWTPKQPIDSLMCPGFKHYSAELRLGRCVGKNHIYYARYREIHHDQLHDIVNDWSKYKRQDFSIGMYYRPNRFLGIRNLYSEYIIGYSKIELKNENPCMNTKDDLLELKVVFMWNFWPN